MENDVTVSEKLHALFSYRKVTRASWWLGSVVKTPSANLGVGRQMKTVKEVVVRIHNGMLLSYEKGCI